MNVRAPGDLVAGRYLLVERIGSGGMGTVFRARDTRLDRLVAIKLLHGGPAADEVTRSRLRAEARFAGSLQHPGIVRVFDYGEDRGPADDDAVTPYVVMQLVDGTPLSRLLRDRGPLPPSTVAALLGDVAGALTVAHAAGVVHRDLKPSNILLTDAGRAVLVDFGIARSDEAEPLTETGTLIGTVDYLSPEQVQGQRANPASDVYALGIVAHQCLSAASPFHRDTQAATALARLHQPPPELPATVPFRLRRLVRSMLALDPGDRPSATEVAERAATAADGPSRVLPPMPDGPITEPQRPARRWRGAHLAAVAAAVALLLALGGVLLPRGHQATPPAGAADLVVPSVRGDQVDRAVRVLHAAGFDVTRTAVDGPAEAGRVLSQSPGPGSYRGEEPTVRLRVASGWVDLPEAQLLGTPYDVAAARLARLGLGAARLDRPTAGGTGTVVDAEPEGRVQAGSVVTLVVATAQPTETSTAAPPHHRHARHHKHHARHHHKHRAPHHHKHHHKHGHKHGHKHHRHH